MTVQPSIMVLVYNPSMLDMMEVSSQELMLLIHHDYVAAGRNEYLCPLNSSSAILLVTHL